VRSPPGRWHKKARASRAVVFSSLPVWLGDMSPMRTGSGVRIVGNKAGRGADCEEVRVRLKEQAKVAA